MPGAPSTNAASQVMPGAQIQTPISLSSHEKGIAASRRPTTFHASAQAASTSTEDPMAEMLRRLNQNPPPPQPATQPSISDLINQLVAILAYPPPTPSETTKQSLLQFLHVLAEACGFTLSLLLDSLQVKQRIKERTTTHIKHVSLKEYGKNKQYRYRSTPYNRPHAKLILSKRPKEILQMESIGATFKPPPRLHFRNAIQHMGKYCDFHDDHGHGTNECRNLKKEILKAVENGKLEHLITHTRQTRRSPKKLTYAWQKGRQEEGGSDPGPPNGHILFTTD